MGDKLKIKHTRMTFDEWNRSIVKKNVYLSEDEEKRYGLIHIEKRKTGVGIFGWPTGSCG